ncbi:MAG TPA: hypothetical protein VGQ39_03085 [Pyrinomonadaceae bacterium]|jgi:hypothetical protein|nr:hypothetical protein [Pyrinomonadaceae bacterium]
MSTEAWRQAAYELLPAFRDRVEAAEDVSMFWIELWDCEVEGVENQSLSDAKIASLFRFASWCLLSDDEKCQGAAIVNFYEMIPTNLSIRQNLTKHLSVDDFIGLQRLFEHNLSKAEHAEFVQEFMTKAKSQPNSGI